MNWNNNDTKYIIKRFIIFMLIAFAMFIISTWKASALTTTATISDIGNSININQNEYTKNYYFTNGISQRPIFENGGEGNLIFSLGTHNSSSPVDQITQVSVGNNTNIFVCDIGTATTYVDSGFQRIIYSVNCPVNINSEGIRYVTIQREDYYGTLQVYIGQYATFVSKDSVNVTVDQQAVTNAINQSTQQMIQQQQSTQQAINDVNNSINNDNVTTSDADDFTNNQAFSDSTGLESVIQLPLNMVNSLTNTCQPIQITIPFINYTGEIPCMSTIYKSKFNSLYTIVKIIINGFFVYRLLLKIYELVHNAKQPDEDKLEVIDL